MILIWDKKEPAPQNLAGETFVWNSYQEDCNQNIFSIPRLVETHASDLRAQYLAFIYELGVSKYKGKRIVDHLQLRPGFSYWWMTLLAEKCNYAKSPQIDDAIKLLALEYFLDQHKVKQIELVSTNAVLDEVLQEWCDKNSVGYNSLRPSQTGPKERGVKQLYKQLPLRIQAINWLLYRMMKHRHLAGVGVEKWLQSNASTSFVSYLFNLVPEAANQSKFESCYWANLPEDLTKNGQPTRWLHLWVKDNVAPSAKAAKQLIERFNCAADSGQVHVTLDSFLSLRIAWNTLVDWIGGQWRARKLESVLGETGSSSFNLWLLLRADWHDSIEGTTAMSNLLMFNLFEAAFAGIPMQKQGCYLQENQGWEFGCISAWSNAGHQNLIGVQHSTVRYWDLRYFFDPHSYRRTIGAGLPMPKQVAVNGPVAKDTYLQGGYPSDQLVEVEALRYLYLSDQDNANVSSVNMHSKNRVLVLGDYLPNNTTQQLEILEKSVDKLDDWRIVIKPHPACPVVLDDYPRLSSMNTYVTDLPINELLSDFGVAYTSLTTSAAVDAYCSGLSVISALDPSVLNLSPLIGVDDVQFVSDSEGLVAALNTVNYLTEPQQYFYLDRALPRWNCLLEFDVDNEALAC